MSEPTILDRVNAVRAALRGVHGGSADGVVSLVNAASELADAAGVDDEKAWSDAWSEQYDLCQAVDRMLDTATKGRPDVFKAALVSYLIEHLSERLRLCLRMPAEAGGEAAPETIPRP